jgi:hypothetical protein
LETLYETETTVKGESEYSTEQNIEAESADKTEKQQEKPSPRQKETENKSKNLRQTSAKQKKTDGNQQSLKKGGIRVKASSKKSETTSRSENSANNRDSVKKSNNNRTSESDAPLESEETDWKEKNGIDGNHKKLDYLFHKNQNRPNHIKNAETELLFHYLAEFNALMREILQKGNEDLELQISDYHRILDVAYRSKEKSDFVTSVDTLLNSVSLSDLSDDNYKKIKREAERYIDACELIYGKRE